MFFDDVAKWAAGDKPAAIVTITKTVGSTPREPGAKMLVGEAGLIAGTIGGGALELLAIRDARQCLEDKIPRVYTYPLCAKTGQCCGGSVETFVDVMNTGPILYVFGAGHVGQALCRVMAGTPFKVRVIDERAEWVGPEVGDGILPQEVKRMLADPMSVVGQLTWDKARTYAVVLTHSHDLDYDLITTLQKIPARFIGLIGSRTKWENFCNKMRQANVDQDLIQRVRCPVGVDIGGKSPQEVAISIAAELIALHHLGRAPGKF